MTESEIVFKSSKFQVARRSIVLADGSTAEREFVVHPGAVVLVPWVDADHVCLIRNRRWAVGRTLFELPAGTLGPGEDPDQAALRELAEETGYRAGRLRRLLEFYPSPGILSELMHLYSAEELTSGLADLEPDEQIVAEVVAWNDALALIDAGRIVDGKTLVGLLFVERQRQRRDG